MYNGFSIDAEADGFLFQSTQMWVMKFEDLDTGEKFEIFPYKDEALAKSQFLEWLAKYEKPNISFHNGLGYDIFAMYFHIGLEFTVGPDTIEGIPVQFVDTFYLSMFLNPDRQRHSIEYFGEKFGFPKMDFRQKLIDHGVISKDAPDGAEFAQHYPFMDQYCEVDTSIGARTYKYLLTEWGEMYGSFDGWTNAFKAGQKSFYLMSCQDLSGWKFDVEYAKELSERIKTMMEDIRAEVEPQLPPRSLKKGEQKEYSMPAKPTKANGEYSATWLKFVEKHSGKLADPLEGTWEFYGKEYKVVPGQLLDVKLPMEMANQDQMKEWFLEMGWKPTLWNYQKDSSGKPIRDPKTRKLIQTSPKIQEAGKLCANLEEMDMPLVKQVVKWLSLRNRASVLEGWMTNYRLEYDGRISAGRTGIAATHRQKHKVVVNVPKADPKVLLGSEFRSLWIAEKGFKIAAGDAAALEGRVQGHYCFKYDGGKTAEELLKGDVHCFDETTEILTESGWKTFDRIGEMKVAQYDNGDISFVEPSEVIWKDYEGEMVSLKSLSIDKLITPNHRVLVENFRTGKQTVKIADQLTGRDANERILTAGLKVGGEELSEAHIQLICAIQSDAHDTGTAYRFEFKKQKKVESLSKSLTQIGAKFSRADHIGRGTVRFYVNKGELKDVITYVDENRELDWKLLEVSARTSEGILKSYGQWDGTVTNNGDVVVDTKSRKTVDVLSALAATAGIKTTVTRDIEKATSFGVCHLDRIYISFKSSAKVRTYGTVSKVQYKGMIGCVTVPSGFIVVRRNGRVCISGNSKNADAFYGDLYPEVREFYNSPAFDKEASFWKPYRNPSKNGFYAILYGAGGPKVASTLKIPLENGTKALEAFWEANPGTAQLKEKLEGYWETKGKSKYLPAIDGRILLTRKKSALLNTIFQSCGGIVMDYAGCFMDVWLGKMYFDEKRRPYYLYKGCVVRRIGYFHDEMEFECEEAVAEEVARMIENSIAKAGEVLKIQVPLVGEGKVGINWKETH